MNDLLKWWVGGFNKCCDEFLSLSLLGLLWPQDDSSRARRRLAADCLRAMECKSAWSPSWLLLIIFSFTSLMSLVQICGCMHVCRCMHVRIWLILVLIFARAQQATAFMEYVDGFNMKCNCRDSFLFVCVWWTYFVFVIFGYLNIYILIVHTVYWHVFLVLCFCEFLCIWRPHRSLTRYSVYSQPGLQLWVAISPP